MRPTVVAGILLSTIACACAFACALSAACGSSSESAPPPIEVEPQAPLPPPAPPPGRPPADAAVDAPLDAGGDAGNGCTEADFAANDRTDAAAPRAIAVPTTTTPAQFVPRCMRVAVNEQVSFSGDLSAFPIVAKLYAAGGGDAGAAFTDSTSTSADGGVAARSVKSASAGVILYDCSKFPMTMYGAVDVVP